MSYYHLELLTPRVEQARSNIGLGGGYAWGGDFYPIWLTSRELLAHRRGPYSAEMTREIQSGLYGRPLSPSHPNDPPISYRRFAYPLYTDLIFAPVAFFPFSLVRIGLAVLLPLSAALAVLAWIYALPHTLSKTQVALILILTLGSYPLLEALFAEQAGIFVATLLAAAVAAATSARYKTAGFLLALATMKPQMALPVILWLFIWTMPAWHRRKSLILTFLASEILLYGLGELLSPGWLLEWFHVLGEYSHYTAPALPSEILGSDLGTAVSCISLVIVAGVCWQLRHARSDSSDFTLAISSVLCVTVLAVQSAAAIYDYFLLFPVVLAIWNWRESLRSQGHGSRILFNLAGALLLWQWTAASAVTVLGLMLPGARMSAFTLRLPLFAILPLPFVLFALLAPKLVRALPWIVHHDAGGNRTFQ